MKTTNAFIIKESGARKGENLTNWDMTNLLTMQDLSLRATKLRAELKELCDQKKKLTPKVSQIFTRKGAKNINIGEIWFTYVKPSTSVRIDRALLEDNFPEIYEAVKIVSPREAQIRVMTSEQRKKIADILSPNEDEEAEADYDNNEYQKPLSFSNTFASVGSRVRGKRNKK